MDHLESKDAREKCRGSWSVEDWPTDWWLTGGLVVRLTSWLTGQSKTKQKKQQCRTKILKPPTVDPSTPRSMKSVASSNSDASSNAKH